MEGSFVWTDYWNDVAVELAARRSVYLESHYARIYAGSGLDSLHR